MMLTSSSRRHSVKTRFSYPLKGVHGPIARQMTGQLRSSVVSRRVELDIAEGGPNAKARQRVGYRC